VLVANVQIDGSLRYLNALYALTVSFRRLRQAYRVNLLAFALKTRLSERALVQHRGQYDLIFQLYATYAPSRYRLSQPHVLYGDCTHRMAEIEYPPWDTFRPRQRQAWYRQERQLYHSAGHIFARSDRQRESLIRFYAVDERRTTTVGAGVNFASWSDSPHVYDGRTMLFVGKDFKRKGGPCLLQAFDLVRQQIPDARLIVVGPKQTIEHDGVEYMGRVNDRKRMQDIYSQSTLFVMPTVFDSWGNVYTEAMAHKLPCIGTPVGGVPEIIVDQETGYLVPPNQPEVLADRLLYLLRDPGLMQEMGEQGYHRVVEQFTWDRVVGRMRPHLDALIEGRA
jgi:glycosyltransferase involved in cell wall biosynthesis